MLISLIEKIFDGLDVCLRPSLLGANQSSQVKVHPEENDGLKLSIALNCLDDAVAVVRLLGTLEGP